MSVEEKSDKKWRSERAHFRFRLIYLPLLLIIFGYIYSDIQSRINPYRHPQIVAESYAPPGGCDVKKYKETDVISETCADKGYIFSDWKKYGLPWAGGPGKINGRECGTYYRVGNDLIAIMCGGRGNLNIKNIEYDVFIVN